MYVWNTFKKPIYITENGIADDTDSQRPKYLLEHIAQVHRAIGGGADIRGYFQWSYIDNFEWKEGFSKRFGLVECDAADPELERKPRPSAYMYSDIIRENAITDAIVEQYEPAAREGVFSRRWR
jgi:beta-glucosidase/6-phospho-beta-glucosidase/beta-galactosidase